MLEKMLVDQKENYNLSWGGKKTYCNSFKKSWRHSLPNNQYESSWMCERKWGIIKAIRIYLQGTDVCTHLHFSLNICWAISVRTTAERHCLPHSHVSMFKSVNVGSVVIPSTGLCLNHLLCKFTHLVPINYKLILHPLLYLELMEPGWCRGFLWEYNAISLGECFWQFLCCSTLFIILDVIFSHYSI